MARTSIILRTPEVQAVLETGRAVIRRPIKPQPESFTDDGMEFTEMKDCPYRVGQMLRVRETWGIHARGSIKPYTDRLSPRCNRDTVKAAGYDLLYKADGKVDSDCPIYWRSPATMPRWASRLNVRIAEIGVEQADSGLWEWVYEVEKEVEKL